MTTVYRNNKFCHDVDNRFITVMMVSFWILLYVTQRIKLGASRAIMEQDMHITLYYCNVITFVIEKCCREIYKNVTLQFEIISLLR